jgi:hypothetical protein
MFEVAQNFLKMGLSAEQAARGIGLTLDEFNELRRHAELKSAGADSSPNGAGTDSR